MRFFGSHNLTINSPEAVANMFQLFYRLRNKIEVIGILCASTLLIYYPLITFHCIKKSERAVTT